MPYKDIEQQRKAQREYARRNKEKNYSYSQVYKKELRVWFEGIKQTLKCGTCGENHPACLDFHHKDEKDKYGSVAQMVSAGYCKEKVLAEIAKCSILCSNCHRKYHYENGSGNHSKIRHIRKNRIKRNDKKWK